MKSILVVSNDEKIFHQIASCFAQGQKVHHASHRQSALEVLRKKRYDLVFVDLETVKETDHPNGYKNTLQPFWQEYPTLQIVVMSSQAMIRDAVMAVKAGASNYLTYPINPEEVRLIAESVHESLLVQSELHYLRGHFWQFEALELSHTESPLMQEVMEKIRSVAPTKSTVLLSGETGTGKGLLAKLIHRHSNRKNASFISVHCGAMPDTLIESELFGHEKGSFTGALRRKLGKFEIAKGGTIFLDEIGTVTPSAQIKLLQILQDKTFQRVGGEETIEADVRIIAATNNDLEIMCRDGLFRRDLFYRLNVFPIDIPPLRERKEDIPALVELFLSRMNKFYSKEINDIHPGLMDALKNYSWPGNIRELENLVERAYVLETSSVLTPESFPRELFEQNTSTPSLSVDPSFTLAEVRSRAVEDIERRYLKELLATRKGKISESAKAAGITTRQLHKLMTKYSIRKEEFKTGPGSKN